jgi:hypothetical protein
MALHTDFPARPYAVPDPSVHWFPTGKELMLPWLFPVPQITRTPSPQSRRSPSLRV